MSGQTVRIVVEGEFEAALLQRVLDDAATLFNVAGGHSAVPSHAASRRWDSDLPVLAIVDRHEAPSLRVLDEQLRYLASYGTRAEVPFDLFIFDPAIEIAFFQAPFDVAALGVMDRDQLEAKGPRGLLVDALGEQGVVELPDQLPEDQIACLRQTTAMVGLRECFERLRARAVGAAV